ncbi:fumarylacetoacetase [Micromonospora sagamiensis]|uniref:fumarylacetoacetase n=1 Tax=Micromonospora sagamiensis TaxID=47875 RepID=A0A562W9V5_9ACTN|nr:fumarylacetoacetase [Micromonospora sagamiensis]TWJ26771.1 fumarylacetoacetate hydrolase [Micromonospora sagamiensis]BCL14341.1 fumarylacetoacetase [Micromonospora sagamiensis]
MSWVTGAAGSPYDVTNLPYGVFRHGGREPRIGVRVADLVFDLAGAEEAGLVLAAGAFGSPTLNDFMALGRPQWTAVRQRLVELLTDPEHRSAVEPLLVPLAEVAMALPFEVADYVDFYSSEHHASNVGQIFRPGQPPLLPNWKHLPVGYHGRAGTVVVSGTPVVRPCGQRATADGPVFGPSVRLDIEAEVGFVVGVGSPLGQRVSVDDLADHVFGVVLVNDWSARDIQAWEYQPLGPFLGKSFATSISAWVTPLDALADAFVPAPDQDPAVLDYLRAVPHRGLDLRLTVEWNGERVSEPPFAGMYWTPAQQLAHLTVNGASLRTGDLYASGTVSGPERGQAGSFLELTWGGAEPVRVGEGTRTFLEDGDTVTMTATAPGPDGSVIALGEVTGTILPAN